MAEKMVFLSTLYLLLCRVGEEPFSFLVRELLQIGQNTAHLLTLRVRPEAREVSIIDNAK